MDMSKISQALVLAGNLIDKTVSNAGTTGVVSMSNAEYPPSGFILFSPPTNTTVINESTYHVVNDDFVIPPNGDSALQVGDAGLFSVGPRHWHTSMGTPYDEMPYKIYVNRQNGVTSVYNVTGNIQFPVFLAKNDNLTLQYTGENNVVVYDDSLWTFTRLSRNVDFQDIYID